MSSSKSSRRRLEGTVKVKPKESATNGTDNSDDDDAVNLTDTEAEDSGKDVKSKKPKGPSQSLNKSVLQLSDDLKKLIDRVTCCSCGKQLNVMNPGAVRKHPWLKVVTCKKCYKFLRSGPFTRDADGTDEQCRWCGDGGRLYGCDYCHNCFCRSCIKRNLGRTEATKMEDDDGSKWHCYMCKPKKIKNLTNDCNKILEYIAKEEKKEKEAEERRAQREKDKAENAEKERKEKTTEKKDSDKKKGFPAPKDKSQVLIKQEIKEESLNVKAGTSSGSRASTPDVIVLDDSPLKVSHHHRAKAYRPDEATGVKQVQKAHNGVLEVTVGPKNSLPIVNPQGGRPQSKMPLLGGILTSNTSVGGSRIVKKAPPPNNIEQLKNNIQPVDIDSKLDRISTMAQSFNLSLSSAKTDMAIAKLTPNVNMYHVRQRTCTQVKSSLEYFLNGLRNIWGVQIVASTDPPQSVGAGDAVTNETKPEKLQATQNIERNNTSTPVKPNSMSALASKLVESPIPIDLESPVKKISEKSKMETDDQESDKPEIIDDSEIVEKKDEDNQLETVSDDVTTEETVNKVNGDDNLPEVIDGEDNMESDNDQVEENNENVESKTDSDTSVSQKSSKKDKTASEDDEKVEKRTRSSKKTENESNKEEDFGEGSEVEENNMDVSENTAAELELLKEMADELNDKEEEDQSTEEEEEVKPRRSARASKTVESTTKEESDKDSPVKRTSRRRGKSDTKSDKNSDKSKTDKQSSKSKTSDKEKEKDASDTENMSTEEETEGKKSKDKVKVDKNKDDIKKSKGKKKKEKEESEDENVSEDETVKSPSKKSTEDETVKSPSKKSTKDETVKSASKKSTETVKSSSKKSKKEVSDSDDDEENNESSTEKSKKANVKKDSKSPKKSVKKPSTNEEEIEKEEKSSKSSDKTKTEKKEGNLDKSDNSDDNLDNDTKSSKKGKDKDTKAKSKGKVSKSKLSVKELDSDNDSTEIEEEKIEVPKKSPKKGKKESPSKKKVQEDSMGVDSDIPTEESDTSDSDDESFEEFGKRRTRRAKAEKEESKKKEKSESKEKSTRSSARRTTRQTGKKSSEDEQSDSDPEFDKDLEKEIKSLSKETRLSKKKQTSEKDNKKGSKQTKEDKKEKDKKKTTKQTIASDDSDLSSSVEMAVSEDENESEDETDNLSPSQLKKLKQAGKEILEGSDDEDDVIAEEISDSSDPEVSFPKLPGKSKKHGLSEDSDDSDFVSTKKSKRFRNKLLDTKITDSESETGKKGKKGKKGKGKGKRKHDSDAFSELSGEEEERQKGKKRRRIKKVASSDEENNKEPGEDDDVGSGEDDAEGTPGKNLKRKHIRKVISTTKQKDETKAAQRAEEERRKRIEERQKEYNTYVEIEGGEDEGEELPEGTEREHQTPVKAADSIAKILGSPRKVPVTTKCVLEMDKEKKKPLVEIDRTLVRKLKPHQVEAVRFMYNCCVESLEQMNKGKGSGCIVAHCMGLGKSLSVVSFVHTMLSHQKLTKMSKCLVVCPLNTVLNWVNEFEIWLDDVDFEIEVYEMSKVKQNFERAQMLKEWHEGDAGVMIIGYDMYRNLVSGSHCKNKKQKKIFYETLADPGPDITVCDEGHILKNDATSLSKAMMKVKSPRRIVLTGTPLQNNLGEYHCMVNFVKPNLLGTRKEFNNRFNNPITNGQCKDSTAFDVKLMKRRAHILHELLAGCVQRKDYSALTKFLPPKFEYVISVRLSPVQMKLYEKYLEMMLGPGADVNNKGARLFRDYQALMRIWTHPWILKLDEIRQENKRPFDDEDEDSFVDDSSGSDSFVDNSSSSSSNESDSESSAAGKKKARKRRTRGGGGSKSSSDDEVKTVNQDEVVKKWTSKRRGNEEGAGSSWMEDMGYGNPDKNGAVTSEWWSEFVKEHDESNLELGGKLVLLFEILKMCEDIGDKVLVFSQSLLSLDIIEDFLQKVDEAQQELNTEDKPSTSGENNKSDKPDSSSKTDDTSTSGEAKEPEEKTEAQKNKENLAKYGRSWTKGADYFRMDGSTNSQNRKTSQDMFNDPENYRARLFLISTKAGSLGINLVSANRVIIFDASWNPSHDIQSIFRVYRFGQIKPVYVYRFLAQGTMEEKIYERQVTKQSLSQRVVDEHQIARHFTANDLQELYKFNPDRLDDPDKKDRPLPNLPKDHMLAELMTSNKEWVTTFHEHDSLLENVVEQELTEEEKKAAWEDYENEKKGLNRVQQMMGGQGLNPAVYATQQMSMQNLLLQGQANLGQAAVLQIVQDLKARFPSLPPEVFQQRVQAVLRQVLTQQLMQNSAIQRQQAQQLEQQRINELNRLNQMKQRIQQQQAMINNPNARYTMGQPSLLQAAMSGGSGLRPQTINQLRLTTPIDLTGQSPQPAKK